jgi:LAO/AO transport system kinase
MNGMPQADRRALARELSRMAGASVAQSLAALRTPAARAARRIGVTGPPGAGKSTLIGRLARLRGAAHGPLSVIAIDPTSPRSRGSLMGDRIRMDALLADTDVHVRSLPTGRSTGGLSDNLADVLAVLDAHSFAEVWIETAGVGQTEYGARALVDVLMLVLDPGAGDQIQAMKAGILEEVDIVVVNKADQSGAPRMAGDLRAVLQRAGNGRRGFEPPVLLASVNDEASIVALSAVLDERIACIAQAARGQSDEWRRSERARFHAQALLHRRIDELAEQASCRVTESGDAGGRDVSGWYAWLVRELARSG